MIRMNLVHTIVLSAIPIGMRKIEDKRSISLHLNISVATDRAIVRALTRAVQDVFLPFPALSIRRPIYAKPLPDISYHPVALPPVENIRSFVGTVRDHRFMHGPVVQIVAVGGVGMRV